jgi:ribosomal protein S18 acetylase RimI-like enzyme
MRPPADQVAGRYPIMAGHTAYPDFRALIATVDGTLAGFSYGFHGGRGQWWHERVRHALGPASADRWLGDCFELAELHVLPEYQARGIGSGLIHALTVVRKERTVVLSTRDRDSVARRLYRGTGFTDLLTGFLFDGAQPAYAVMGAELPLRAARPSR